MNQESRIKNCEGGQSLIELLVAMGIFVVIISSIAFLIIDSYVSNRAAQERTQATFLAEEGLEAVRSIRDNDWKNLRVTDEKGHGLTTSQGYWEFEDTFEAKDVSGQLREGKREIFIEDIGSDRKKVTCEVTWKLTGLRFQEVSLVTYLTNWKKTVTCNKLCKEDGYDKGKCTEPESCKGVGLFILEELGECEALDICCCEYEYEYE